MAKSISFRARGECTASKIEERTKASVYLPRAFYDRLRTMAFTQGTTVSEIIRTVVENYMSALDATPTQTEAV